MFSFSLEDKKYNVGYISEKKTDIVLEKLEKRLFYIIIL